MPQIGDLFAKLAQGQQLTSGEIEQLRLGMNQQQNATSRLASLITPSGDLDPNIFSHHSGEFSVLPHESASMVSFAENQAIPHATATTLTYKADADLSETEKRHSWSYGIDRNTATGEFTLKGIPEETVWLVSIFVGWENEPTFTTLATVLETGTALGHGIADDASSIIKDQVYSFKIGRASCRERV